MRTRLEWSLRRSWTGPLLGSSSIDEEDAEVELENEPVRWTERDVEGDGATQKWTLGEFDQSELSMCGTWRQVVYMDDEKWFSVEEERNMAKAEVLRMQVIERTGEKDVHTGDEGLNVLGHGKSVDVGAFKQMRGTCNPKSEHWSPDTEKPNIPARTPGIPEVDTRKIRDDPAEKVHRVQQAAAKQVWFRFEGKTRLKDIWGQDWEIEKRRPGRGWDLGRTWTSF